jgi:hypothetical protein
MGQLRILGASGDTKIEWNPKSRDEIKEAQKMFNQMVKEKKMTAWRIDPKGRKDKELKEFDPRAGMILLVPPTKGGNK